MMSLYGVRRDGLFLQLNKATGSFSNSWAKNRCVCRCSEHLCPGPKEQELVLVKSSLRWSSLFRTHHINPIVHSGEEVGHARQRILHMIMDSSMGFLLQIRNPTSVSVEWVPN